MTINVLIVSCFVCTPGREPDAFAIVNGNPNKIPIPINLKPHCYDFSPLWTFPLSNKDTQEGEALLLHDISI